MDIDPSSPAAGGGAPAMSNSAQYAIWIVRVVLPIIFFWIWYRTQPNKVTRYPGPTEHKRPRTELLAARKAAVPGELAPESLATIKLVNEEEVAPRGGGAGKNAGARRDQKGAKAKQGDKARTPIGAEGKRPSGLSEQEADPPTPSQGLTLEPEIPEKDSGNRLTDEERMHLESLLNFVAFSHKDRPERTFLPNEECPPPPPRRKCPPPADSAEEAAPSAGASRPGVADASTDAQAQTVANSEAQMVLQGVVSQKLGLKRSDLAKDLYQQLLTSQVVIAEATYSLMTEACINASDLKGASDFLMKMESAGYCPDSDLLDKVMDLYSDTRAAPAVVPSSVMPSVGEAVPFGGQGYADTSEATRRHPWTSSSGGAGFGAPSGRPTPAVQPNFDAFSDVDDDDEQ